MMPIKIYKKIETIVLYFVMKKNLEISFQNGPEHETKSVIPEMNILSIYLLDIFFSSLITFQLYYCVLSIFCMVNFFRGFYPNGNYSIFSLNLTFGG